MRLVMVDHRLLNHRRHAPGGQHSATKLGVPGVQQRTHLRRVDRYATYSGVVLGQLQHEQLAHVVHQTVEKRLLRVHARPLGDRLAQDRRADGVLCQPRAVWSVGPALLLPRRQARCKHHVSNRGRAEAHDGVPDRRDLLQRGAVGRVGQPQHPGGQHLVARGDVYQLRDADVGIQREYHDVAGVGRKRQRGRGR